MLKRKLINSFGIGVLSISSVTLIGCVHEDETSSCTPGGEHFAVISTQASDNSTGDVSIIGLNDYCADNSNFAGGSDAVISTHGEIFYRLGRYQQDNITKFDIDHPESTVWQYSTNGDEELSNPYKLITKDATTAYLIRYGSAKVWIVDPTASSVEDFKINDIDLSQYSEGDGVPEVADALLIDDKLYLLMQNIDQDNGWIPGQAYLAVYETTNHTEIETNSDADSPKGIALQVTNPSEMGYLSTTNKLYIAGVGPYVNVDYSGGIESIDLTDYSSELLVDDGDVDAHPYGQITNIAILNSTRGYFVGYSAWQDTAVYTFNPSTGDVEATPLVEHKDISDIEIGPMGDLWITDRGASGVMIIDTVDNSVKQELISTGLLPSDIEFVSVDTNE